jgi:phage gp37-like protein
MYGEHSIRRHTGPTPSAPTGGGRRRWPAFGMARVTGGARLSRRILQTFAAGMNGERTSAIFLLSTTASSRISE